MIAGPTGMSLGIIAGAILGDLLGGATGCSAGATLGKLIDDKILNNYRCIDCAHTFSQVSEFPTARTRAAFDDLESFGPNGFTSPDSEEPVPSLHF